ncbi:CHY zinc finger protein [Halobacillus salinus]|uniref:CHY-type domain-containing protein n=1 Tax=Halobacillus salinus TaxID=192814 RepID=A0A4Z0H1S7_9BACI|nr:CHY zinc finger protein [Halobacillus salinus]TGB03834.1 hypothetical protein E4663_02155 [Halobacillus salinus]
MTHIRVKGVQVDQESRCAHYHGEVDVIALKSPCCGEFYACYHCHEEIAGHPLKKWSKSDRDHHAILCGHCQNTMSINVYMQTNVCPHCEHALNPGCANHYPIYFEMS